MSFLFSHKVRALFSLLPVVFGVSGCAYISSEQPRAPALPALAKPAEFTVADADFVQALNALDLAQITLAKAAVTHAGRSDLALLGATIAKDLSAVQAQLAKVAAAHALTLPTRPGPAEQKRIDRVQRAHGAVFDRRYVRFFAAASAQVKPVLARQIAIGKDPALLAIARDVQTRLADYGAAMQ